MTNDPTATKHVVTAGEQGLARIAATHGFRVIDPVWDEPGNAALRKQRVNPNTLAVGDSIVIPILEQKREIKATNRTHLFTLSIDELLLNITLQTEARKPLAKRAFRLVVGRRNAVNTPVQTFAPIDGVTNDTGALGAEIDRFASEGEITVHATADATSPVVSVVRLLIGFLDPASTQDGQRTRLNNLGYFAGFSAKDTEQLKWAIEEFQADHGIKPTGRSDDRITFNRIAHEHGDLLASENVP